jgi:oligoendopeptidase F
MKQIHKIATQLESLDVVLNEKSWTMFTTGMDFGVDEANKKRTAFFKDKKHFSTIEKHMGKTLDPVDKRRVEILHQKFKWHHVSGKANRIYGQIEKLETDLSDLINKHRVTLDGKEANTTQIAKILNESPDRELRKRAYLSRAQVNQPLVDGGFLKLVDLRKEYAQACKAKDFIALRLEADELTPDLFDGWSEELKKRKKDLRKKQKDLGQKLLGVEDLMPWDYGFLKNTMCRDNNARVDITNFFEPIEKTFAAYGWNDIGGLNISYDVFPRKNKSEWGYMFTIRPGQDARILANVNDRFSSFNVLLHETAHGVHFLGLNPEERLLNMGVSGIVAEGFANFFGELCNSKEFLTQVFGRDIEDKLKSFTLLSRVKELLQFDHVAITMFDHELYRADLKTNDDIQNLRNSMFKNLLDVQPSADPVPWGFRVHHTVVPIYMHNYFLGDVMTANMKRAFKKQYGSEAEASPKRFGRFWREKVLQPSGLYPFPELYEKVCGGKLKLGPYLDKCLKISVPKQASPARLVEGGRLKDMEL